MKVKLMVLIVVAVALGACMETDESEWETGAAEEAETPKEQNPAEWPAQVNPANAFTVPPVLPRIACAEPASAAGRVETTAPDAVEEE